MKIGGTIAFWVKVGLILAVGASVLYLWKKAKGLLPSKEQIQQTLESFVPSLSLPLATPAQQAAATDISMWQSTPFVGPLAGWLVSRYYQWNPPYESLSEDSSTLPLATTAQQSAVTNISMWQSIPFVGPLAGWIASRYYDWNPPYETLPEGSSNDVGVSTPRDTPITEIPQTNEEIYDYLQRYPG